MENICKISRQASVATALLVLGCGEPMPDPEPPCEDACACLHEDGSLLPWPSDCFTVEDPTTGTDRRLVLPREAMPRGTRGRVDPAPWNEWDGFSAMTSAMIELPARIDGSALPSWRDDAPGLDPGSPTIVLDAETGERVAHFAELRAPEGEAQTSMLFVRPVARLEERRRYVIGVRGLTDEAGAPLAPRPEFARLLATGDPTFEADVIAPLTEAGVESTSLLAAWTFTTGTGGYAWADLVRMASLAFEEAGEDGLGCTVAQVDESPDGFTVVDGTFTVPRFLLEDAPDALLARDLEGGLLIAGTMEAPFRAMIPDAVVEGVRAGAPPAAVVLYGHGLFDDRRRVSQPGDDGRAPPVEVAERCGGQIWVATDTTGLATDMTAALRGLTDLEAFDVLFDQVRQALVSTLLLPRTFAGQCALLPELQVEGAPLVHPTERYYYGNSQGAILGTTLAALSPDVERFALGVGGISYPIMLPRSVNWPALGGILAGAYPERRDQDLAMVMFAQRWDLVEGAAFAPHVLTDPLPGMRSRPARVLYQVGLHDAQTPNVASEIAARTLGLPQGGTSDHTVWGLPTREGTVPSAYRCYDVGAEPLPDDGSPPPEDNGVHEAVRRLDEAQDEVCAFLRPDGAIEL